jgi:hypothetical protein
MAATPSTSILTTSNHHTVAARHQSDGTVAAGLQTKQFQPPRPHRVDVLSRFGVNDTSAAPTMATTPLFSTLLASNTHPVAAGHLGDGKWVMGMAGFGGLEAGVSDDDVPRCSRATETRMGSAFNSSGCTSQPFK